MLEMESFDDINYWPGYVDAIFNFTLNILFVLALFVVLSSMIEFSESNTEQDTSPRAAEEQTLLKSQAKNITVTPAQAISSSSAATTGTAEKTQVVQIPELPFSTPEPSGEELNLEQVQVPTITFKNASNGVPALLTIDFLNANTTVTPERIVELEESVTALRLTNREQQWLIWTTVDGRENTQARLAYIRMMAIREALLGIGLPEHVIRLRLLDVREAGTENQTKVFLTVFGQN